MTHPAPAPELAKMKAARNALDLRMIPTADIAADPDQPRKTFDAASLEELGASLKQGQTSAIRVRPRRADEEFPAEVKWVLVHGERRWRAAKKAAITVLRAEIVWSIVADDAGEVLLDQIADNLQRVDLGAVEEAAGIRRYAELSGLGTRDVAARIGKNQMYVSLALGMGDMPATILKRIEEDAADADKGGYRFTWRHLRQFLRLKDEPEALDQVYRDAVLYQSSARELEDAVSRDLEYIERRRLRQAAAAKATEEGSAPEPAPAADGPMSHLSEKQKREALEKARMTRARKDVLRGILPEIVAQVATIAKTIRLPQGLASVVAGRIGGYDVWSLAAGRGSGARTHYGENIAELVVPALPGKWAKVRVGGLGSAMNGGRWAEDEEAGRHWLAFAYWLATETKGMDADLDRQSRDVLKARDQRVSAETRTAERLAKRAAKHTDAAPKMQQCARVECNSMFHVKRGPGRRPKYCPKHRSK